MREKKPKNRPKKKKERKRADTTENKVAMS